MIELEKQLFELRSRLEAIDNPRKMLIHALRTAVEILDASAGAVAILVHSRQSVELVFSDPRSEEWNIGLVSDFIKGKRPTIPDGLVIAQIKRRGKIWGALAVKPKEPPVDGDAVKALQKVSQVLSERVYAWDDSRLRRLRSRIEHKIANRQDPKDILYDILHGLRSLTRYDHSASFLIASDASEPLTLIAEQIAWKKGKSNLVGTKLPLDGSAARELAISGVSLFQRAGGLLVKQGGDCASSLMKALDYNAQSAEEVPREDSLIVAVVHTPDSSAGVLRVASRSKEALGRFEANLIEQFTPLISLSVQFLLSTWAFRREILEAIRENTLVDVARGVAHDINNSLGAVLPLIQQIQNEASSNELEISTLRRDLDEIELGLCSCRRIFSGMLAAARTGDHSSEECNLRHALDTSLGLVQNRLKRHDITVKLAIDIQSPSVRGSQGDITRVFWNLFQNAIEAMPQGGELTITAADFENMIAVQVSDSGRGIPADLIDEITNAYVTTKADGHGLGLSVCRSIMWEIGGLMSFSSAQDKGTDVYLQFPKATVKPSDRDERTLEDTGSR